MHFCIVGGGTGGHVYPALATLQALRAVAPEARISWMGSRGGLEIALVERAGVPFFGIPGGGLHGIAFLNAIRHAWELVRGFFVARRLLRRDRPQAVLTTGGFVSAPVAVAARTLRIPILVFLPDIEPAQSVRFVGRLADRIAVSVPDSQAFFPSNKTVVTGYPLREEFTAWDRASGRAALGLPAATPVLVVFGGSRGARSINRALLAHIESLTELAVVVHVSGELDWPHVEQQRSELPEAVQQRYRAYAYLHDEMGAAIAAADLVLCRAGASVLAELPYYGAPSVLVPYPYAWRYQRVNADWLANRGAAVVLEDKDLHRDMMTVVGDLLRAEDRRAAMRSSAQALAQPKAAETLAALLLSLGSGG